LLTETTTSSADQPAQPGTDDPATEHAADPATVTAADPPPAPAQAAPEPNAPEPEEAAIESARLEALPPETPAAEEPPPDTAAPAAAAHAEASVPAHAESVPIVAVGEIVVDATAPVRAVFADLGLSDPILRAIAEMGYAHPTPIQEQAIPIVLMGRDVLGVAQTGTGKTAGFTLPMLDILAGSRARARMPRSLILEPTRELALQVAENFVQYGKHLKLTHALLIGGESMNDQKDALMRGVDVLIATPGRLIDLFERGGLLLTDTRILVIDEADRMLDMGFIPDVERIVAMLPRTRQTLFFSATMAPEIKRLADAFLQNPKVITVSRAASVAPTIVAGLALIEDSDKRDALRRLIASENVQNALIFCNRKIEVDALTKSLKRHDFNVAALHGDLSQPERTATMARFKANELRLLVCSDVAARGLDISGLSHVFNFDVPHHAEDYVHRIGRTGRAGLTGHAFTLATPEDRLAVEAIEHLVGAQIPRITVEGLPTAEWAEGDGKKRRGRGRTAAPAKSAPKDAPKPRARKAAEPATAAVAAAPAVVPEKALRRPRPPRPDVAREPARQAEPVAPVVAAPVRERPPRRDGRYRDDDLGPAVQGFGDDVPAFMMIRLRTRVPTARQSEDVDA
jgi:superfamily II DNA/RNA helicase